MFIKPWFIIIKLSNSADSKVKKKKELVEGQNNF